MLLLTAASFATPAVGDYSMFKLSIAQGGSTTPGTYEASLIGKDNAGSYKMKRSSRSKANNHRAKKKWLSQIDLSQMLNPRNFKGLQSYGGKDGSYELPDHSKLPTCVLPSNDDAGKPTGEVHIAQVPFGIAKTSSMKSGRVLTLELQTFVNGK